MMHIPSSVISLCQHAASSTQNGRAEVLVSTRLECTQPISEQICHASDPRASAILIELNNAKAKAKFKAHERQDSFST